MATRINRYIAQATGLSRRAADEAVANGRVAINGQPAKLGDTVEDTDAVTFDRSPVTPESQNTTVMFNKPVGYVCSRDGQGAKTVYDLLPYEMQNLRMVGRLDKDSSGLLLLTNDGKLAHQLTHPGFQKKKVYEITLNKALLEKDAEAIQQGIALEDGVSLLLLKGAGKIWQITMYEGRNRQIRRTFEHLGYTVEKLHRTKFGPYRLASLAEGQTKNIEQ